MTLLNDITALMPTMCGHHADVVAPTGDVGADASGTAVGGGTSGAGGGGTIGAAGAAGAHGDEAGRASGATSSGARSAGAAGARGSAAFESVDVAAVARELQSQMRAMNDAEIAAVMVESGAVEQYAALVRQVATGIASARSSREFGHGGFAATRGHNSATSFVQSIMGVSKGEAAKQVRVGESIVEVSGVAALPDSATSDADRAAQAQLDAELQAETEARALDDEGVEGSEPVKCVEQPWYHPLTTARYANELTADQFDAIRKGLGEPPRMPRDADGNPLPVMVRADALHDGEASTDTAAGGGVEGADGPNGVAGDGAADVDVDVDSGNAGDELVEHTPTIEEADAFDAAAREAWSLAAEQLVAEARVRKVNDLAGHARYLRDKLDPEGARRRFDERYEARSFRITQTDNGAVRITWVLDDQTALMVTAAHDAALRPRRGGPRFADSAEAEKAKALSDDPRTNEQLASDLMADIIRAGILADARSVFGTRQAGVRLVQVIDADGHRSDVAHAEDRLAVLPGAVAEQHLCNTESIHAIVDTDGNSLNLGRSKRMFTPAQKIALAIRDGGCRWTDCDRPASYTEAHHIDPWKEGGKTDIDRGILLCHYHHLHAHNNGWRITREGKGEFMLTHPDHPPQPLPVRAPLKYAWSDITLPEPRFRPVGSRPSRQPTAA